MLRSSDTARGGDCHDGGSSGGGFAGTNTAKLFSVAPTAPGFGASNATGPGCIRSGRRAHTALVAGRAHDCLPDNALEPYISLDGGAANERLVTAVYLMDANGANTFEPFTRDTAWSAYYDWNVRWGSDGSVYFSRSYETNSETGPLFHLDLIRDGEVISEVITKLGSPPVPCSSNSAHWSSMVPSPVDAEPDVLVWGCAGGGNLHVGSLTQRDRSSQCCGWEWRLVAERHTDRVRHGRPKPGIHIEGDHCQRCDGSATRTSTHRRTPSSSTARRASPTSTESKSTTGPTTAILRDHRQDPVRGPRRLPRASSDDDKGLSADQGGRHEPPQHRARRRQLVEQHCQRVAAMPPRSLRQHREPRRRRPGAAVDGSVFKLLSDVEGSTTAARPVP